MRFIILALSYLIFLSKSSVIAQDQAEKTTFSEPGTALWLGTYSNFRLGKKIFWAGETHFRTNEYNDVKYVGRMGQIYNRHGIKYLFSKNFSVTAGGVLRLDFSPEPGNDDYKGLTIEPRIWHEYLFALPIERLMIYHRIRLEHRWTRSALADKPEYSFRSRFRYKFLMKIPLNKPDLIPGALYFSPDIEIIMQSGKSVVNSPMEDVRLYPLVGYILNPRISVSAGIAYTFGQTLDDGSMMRTRWLLRANAYFSLDFRKFEEKIPAIKYFD